MNTAFFKKHTLLVLLLLLVFLMIPSFWRMLKPGIYSMHDFHIFRIYEYDKCLADFQIPCRWTPDSAFEYGQPMFNFYTQLPYVFGELFRPILSIINTFKLLMILSLVLSGISMFFLSKQLWKDNTAGLISALIYVYAPYRAVDVWVRGALPEALAFIFFPLITYFFNKFVFQKRKNDLVLFSLSFSGLVLTHNLSALMYLFFLIPWGIFMLTKHKQWNLWPKFLISGVLIFGLTSFYTLPVIFESNLITLGDTTQGYYNFQLHYVTLKQLLISRYWGYGASLWGDDDRLSLSVGHLQWILPMLVLGFLLLKKKVKTNLEFLVLLLIGWGFLLLTHGKSEFLWLHFKPITYIQFPWRFLGSAVFCFALASGIAMTMIQKLEIKVVKVAVILAILLSLNTGFFFEDLWFRVDDEQQFSGARYKEQTSSALTDFWPQTAKFIPSNFAPDHPLVINGQGSGRQLSRKSNGGEYKFEITTPTATGIFPIVYFPGWVAYLDGKPVKTYPREEQGLVAADLTEGSHEVWLKFEDTTIRSLGNWLSLISILGVILLLWRYQKRNET